MTLNLNSIISLAPGYYILPLKILWTGNGSISSSFCEKINENCIQWILMTVVVLTSCSNLEEGIELTPVNPIISCGEQSQALIGARYIANVSLRCRSGLVAIKTGVF